MKLINLFNKPAVIGLVSNSNEGKSMLIYDLIDRLKSKMQFNLVTYGLRKLVNSQEINSIEELERCKNSLVILDEFQTLFDLDDRKKKKLIENTLRLVFHNNNILILSGLAENFKKFLSNKLHIVIFKRVSFGDFINGSKVKNIALNYKGIEGGSTLLDIDKSKAIVFDGNHYFNINVRYLKEYDTKLNNKPIFSSIKNVDKKCSKNVPLNSEKKDLKNMEYLN